MTGGFEPLLFSAPRIAGAEPARAMPVVVFKNPRLDVCDWVMIISVVFNVVGPARKGILVIVRELRTDDTSPGDRFW